MLTSVSQISLRRIGLEARAECIGLRLAEPQADWVAPNRESLDDADSDPCFVPLGIYADDRMVGFVMYEIRGEVGFIRRLMVDECFQRRGYGQAAVSQVIRELQRQPAVKVIATRHRRENQVAARLYRSLGFVSWETDAALAHPFEVYLRLSD